MTSLCLLSTRIRRKLRHRFSVRVRVRVRVRFRLRVRISIGMVRAKMIWTPSSVSYAYSGDSCSLC